MTEREILEEQATKEIDQVKKSLDMLERLRVNRYESINSSMQALIEIAKLQIKVSAENTALIKRLTETIEESLTK